MSLLEAAWAWQTEVVTSTEARPWWERMVEVSAESDKEQGPTALDPGEKLAALLRLAAHLPVRYSDELEYPVFGKR